jgi:hypothetical protein
MSIEGINSQVSILYNEISSNYILHFLESFKDVNIIDPNKGTILDFEILDRIKRERVNPIIKFATSRDIDEILFIYKDIYEETYPYKEMEDYHYIKKTMESDNYEWFKFEGRNGEIFGCLTFVLDFNDMKGYARGLLVKKKYLGKIDVLKAFIGSFLVMCRKYEGKILRWYGESRTAHSKSQYIMSHCGFRPIAFYPNKDIFYDEIESDILLICYDERALRKYRSKMIPVIIPEVKNLYKYSHNRYNLGNFEIEKPRFQLDYNELAKLKKRLIKRISKDKFGYQKITFSIQGSQSYFKFLYTPNVKNFEKTEYKVESLEELFVFTQEFIKLARNFNIRYLEVFTSAYEVNHQKIFHDIGLKPCGYIPSWKYNKETGYFDDYILFNYNIGEIDKNIMLQEEGKKLLRCLEYV